MVIPFLTSPNPNAMPIIDTVTVLALQESTQSRSLVNLVLNGNITASQISNPTLTNQAGNKTVLSFNLAGQSGTSGFCNITVPKTVVCSGVSPTVSIDNQIASNQGYTQDDANYYVWYTTEFSTHEVSIVFQLKQQVPAYSLIILSFFILISVSAKIIFYKRKGRSKSP